MPKDLSRNLREPFPWVEPNWIFEANKRSRGEMEVGGLIVVKKRGNSRGAKGPNSFHVIQESSHSLG